MGMSDSARLSCRRAGSFRACCGKLKPHEASFVNVGIIGVYCASRVSWKLGLEFLFPVSFLAITSCLIVAGQCGVASRHPPLDM
jgi:hypothetical protein